MKNLTLNLLKSLLIFFGVSIVVLAIILLPREPVVMSEGTFHMETVFPFGWEGYIANIQHFFTDLIANGGFGAVKTGIPVMEAAGTYLGRSLEIILPAFFISVLFGIIIGVANFVNYHRKRGIALRVVNWLCTAVPDFFIVVGLQFFIILLIRWGFPSFSLFSDDKWYSFILPMLVVAIYPTMYLANLTQQALLQQEDHDYVRTARSKGTSSFRVVSFHMLWNSWPTILTHVQTVMLYVLSSLPIIELLTGYRGAAYYLLQSIQNYDTNMTVVLLFAFMLLILASVWFSQIVKYAVMNAQAEES
ncbi:ABC transporter permease subunit [Lentibacillus sp. Marseille-P4043]|uniref:ABC transporter permease subunit n=1 Tax=Lentibacillus sp. Marseille-P4043 TaxID=2040293 RepID=UPI000D0B96EF|nr:ABC transporter permease [Lentibacillus sp. Marseille-P4043]